MTDGVNSTPWYAFMIATGIAMFCSELLAVFPPLEPPEAQETFLWAAFSGATGSMALGVAWPQLRWKWAVVLTGITAVTVAVKSIFDTDIFWYRSQAIYALLGFFAGSFLMAEVGSAAGHFWGLLTTRSNRDAPKRRAP